MIVYLVFLLCSGLILMKIYGYSTYHKFFKNAAVVLIIYGSLLGYLFFALGLHQFFVWHLVLTLLLLSGKYFGMGREVSKIKESGLDKMTTKEFLQLSVKRTRNYYILSSVIYLFAFILSYSYLYNS